MTSSSAPPGNSGARCGYGRREGPGIYNPFAHGTDTELADKVLAGETYTEPHYLRQAQRYLGHAVRGLRAMNYPVTVAMLADAMDPARLEVWVRELPEEHAKRIHDYLDSLSGEQKRGLAGRATGWRSWLSQTSRGSSTAASRPATTSTWSPPSAGATSSCSASTQTAGRCSPACSPRRSCRTC
jgi:hypothetical protein